MPQVGLHGWTSVAQLQRLRSTSTVLRFAPSLLQSVPSVRASVHPSPSHLRCRTKNHQSFDLRFRPSGPASVRIYVRVYMYIDVHIHSYLCICCLLRTGSTYVRNGWIPTRERRSNRDGTDRPLATDRRITFEKLIFFRPAVPSVVTRARARST